MEDASGAAIVCSHVAEGVPIVRAIRDEPLEAADSGWQFLCARSHADSINEAQVWSLSDVTGVAPSLLAFINAPVGTRLWRRDERSPWQAQQPNS